jgi:hypothetical protein
MGADPVPAAVFAADESVVFYFMGVYRGMWRYTSIPTPCGLPGAILATLTLMDGADDPAAFMGNSRAVFGSDCIFTLFFCGGFRIAIRLVGTSRSRCSSCGTAGRRTACPCATCGC